ncbi:hydantoinase/oxoprolinase family protein [Aquibacillus sp. 3ASR75-11]|uniref:Hydantoinase/oxoprolinase family protein n=1 Tax=Terrihalobacillus insolitus TaxID=2950438 RepID=A0A9X4AN39_9BACI|nr:hydantoinase/oxoprolinase family protein [Terrihalobacillus insolitus]MDC3425454.1 hydantoinase/oxoprolinase family protein [Terrihalobacillus insolitus]
MGRYRLGVDIGGTFTDVVLHDKQTEHYSTEKIPTTPGNLSEGVLNGVTKLVEDFSDVDFFVHGTTVGLNAFLERKGAKMALIVTKGFRDLYEIGRANRSEIYNIQYRQPSPLIKRRNIYEVEERVLVDGSVGTSLNIESLEQVIENISEREYDSVSVCLLHAYKNPDHEKEIKTIIKEKLPRMSVSLSHEVVREWREYERTSTTVINAYIAPIVENYLTKFEKEAVNKGLDGSLYIMQSNGGVMTSEIAKEKPIQTLMSGPVGGTMGSIQLGKTTDHKNLICVDMGGTSFDVSIVINGEPDVTAEASLEKFPIMSPMVNIHTIGAGGGSIAWLEGGGLRVGPHSAGANPGPACYGNGGTEATVTDANLVLGRIDSEGFLGGNMKLDIDASFKAIEKLAIQLNLSVIETAEGICEIANAKMADAIRTLTISKGIDPRDFALVAFGGAGPMHSVLIAEHLGIDRILIPTVAGTFSAWGMLKTDIRHDDVRTFVSLLSDCDKEKMNALYQEMQRGTSDVLKQQKMQSNQMQFTWLADLRYVGQEYTVTVTCSPGKITDQSLKQLSQLFHENHLKIYGHNDPSGIVEVVNLRVVGYGKLENEEKATTTNKSQKKPDPIRMKPIVWYGQEEETPVYSIQDLSYGQEINGPTVIESPTSTIVVPANYHVDVDRVGNLEIIRRNNR